MDILKLYFNQCFTYAASNLRLNSEKIVTVTFFKDFLSRQDNYTELFNQMKKITELSKIAIHLGEINAYCLDPKIDMLKFSDKFKEHAFILSKDLTPFLEAVTSARIKEVLDELEKKLKPIPISTPDEVVPKQEEPVKKEITKKENEKLKEDFILEEEDYEYSFEYFQKTVLNPIKEIDGFLGRLENMETTYDEMEKYYKIIEANSKLSQKSGFEIITNMHNYFSGTLKLIMDSLITADHVTIDKMRACLIVIAALIREKDVDITNYLNKAEKLGKMLQNN